MIFHRNGNERGEITIEVIQLNRPELIEKRADKIKNILKALESCSRTNNDQLKANALAALQLEASPDKEFSLAAKHFLAANVQR